MTGPAPHLYVLDDGFYCGKAGCGLPREHASHVEPEPVLAAEPRVPADVDLPSLPYGGAVANSGWSGSHASRERAETRDSDGSTSKVQYALLGMAATAGRAGVTVAEAKRVPGFEHHGTTSGALSDLHEHGHLARLTVKRMRCSIYVLPEHVDGRETAKHGRKRVDEDARSLLGEMGDQTVAEDVRLHMMDKVPRLRQMRADDVHAALSAFALYVLERPERH